MIRKCNILFKHFNRAIILLFLSKIFKWITACDRCVLNSQRELSPFLLHHITMSVKDFFIIFRHHGFLLEWPFLKVKESRCIFFSPFPWGWLFSARIIAASSPWSTLKLLSHFCPWRTWTWELLTWIRFWSNDLEVQDQYWGAILLLFLLRLASKILNKQCSPVLFLPCLSLTVYKGLVQSPLITGIEKGRNSYTLIRNKINYYF